jgi:hypothetical protein
VKRAGYLAVTLLLTVVAIVAFSVGGHAGGAIAVGAGIAWGVQAGSFWLLAGRLERGGPALRVWVLGIVLRFGVGLFVWLLAVLAGAPTRELMVAYGLALAAFLMVEAGWLAVATSRTTAGGT